MVRIPGSVRGPHEGYWAHGFRVVLSMFGEDGCAVKASKQEERSSSDHFVGESGYEDEY